MKPRDCATAQDGGLWASPAARQVVIPFGGSLLRRTGATLKGKVCVFLGGEGQGDLGGATLCAVTACRGPGNAVQPFSHVLMRKCSGLVQLLPVARTIPTCPTWWAAGAGSQGPGSVEA